MKALVNANRRITTREIGLRLNLSNSTVYDHLKGPGLSSKLHVWVPHVLTERNLRRRIDVCDSLLKRHENDPFLKRIITGDEKGHGAKKMNRLKPFAKPIFTKKDSEEKLPRDCYQVQRELKNETGVYRIQPDYAKRPIFVYCDMETDGGGWTCAKIKDEVEKLAYQLNGEAERTERPIRRLRKVMYGSTCADMQVDVMGECLSSIKHVVGVRSVFLAKRLHAV
ncbi:uncharacterized protein TNCV_3707811 [Trichonephila clavipes]|nr:uncharacterized protein TNCV_3707811 [Trichonephila clavipes]